MPSAACSCCGVGTGAGAGAGGGGTTKVRGARSQYDFTGRYQLTQKVTLFLDLVNFTSYNGLKYRGFVDPVYRNETNALGFLATAGVLISF